MTFWGRMTFVIAMLVLTMNTVHASTNKDAIYRNFWLPNYHGQRLNYCALDRKDCGLAIANRYCHLMGYAYADQQTIDYNVGQTAFLSTNAHCRGWRCNGFKTIRCVSTMSHNPAKPYYYRSKRFVYPRFNHERVAWCYDGQKGCGQRAAVSFCRRLGYLASPRFVVEKKVAATKAIGNQKRCFGKHCRAFEYIDCYR